MEFSIDSILAILGVLFGGGGLGSFIYFKRRAKADAMKAEAEAKQADAQAQAAVIEAAQEMQNMYQQLITDIKTDRDEQKTYINELKDDRRHLRNERDELRKRQDELEESVRSLQRDVARNGRMVESMRPFLCGKLDCKDRQRVIMSAEGEIEKNAATKSRHTRKKEEEE